MADPTPISREPQELTIDQIFANFKRELRFAETPGFGRIHFYVPQSAAEFDAYYRHIRFDDNGIVRVSLDGIVSGIIARAKTSSGAPLFNQSHCEKLMALPSEVVLAIWDAFGAERARPATENG